ncbi:MAG: hypothetical protein FWC41_12770 [Firmicutes bacterium]|nr:hypothetical protein [Bacillota bacterium]
MSKAKELAKKAKEDITELAEILENAEMGIRSANAQTKATEKWNEKKGLATKSYKLNAETAEAFKQACEKNGKTQGEALTALMTAYISGRVNIRPCLICRVIERLRKK